MLILRIAVILFHRYAIAFIAATFLDKRAVYAATDDMILYLLGRHPVWVNGEL